MELNHKIYGQGDPIIILHGLFGMLDNWKTIADRLSEHHMVILVDQRNHGRSPHEDGINYDLMAEDLMHFMEDNWIHKAHIIGHSMGGKTALRFAIDHGDMVDKLVVVDMGIKSYPAGHQLIFEALNAVPIDSITSRSEAEEYLAQFITSKAVRLFLMKNLTRKKNGGYQWKMNLPVIEQHYEEILDAVKPDHAVDVDTLFIRGEKSNYIQEEDKSEIKTLFPLAQFVDINAGHWVHAEKPDELLMTINEFIN